MSHAPLFAVTMTNPAKFWRPGAQESAWTTGRGSTVRSFTGGAISSNSRRSALLRAMRAYSTVKGVPKRRASSIPFA